MTQLKSKLYKLRKTGFFHVFGGSVLNKIISFLSSVVLVRILSKGEYGIFTYAWNIYSIILLFNGLGLESSTLQICSENNTDKEHVYKICKFSLIKGSFFNLILCIILVVIGLFIPLNIDGASSLLILLCLLPSFHYIWNLISVFLRSQKRNREFAIVSVFGTALTFLFQAMGAVFFRQKGMIYGAYLSTFILIVGAYIFIYDIKCIITNKGSVSNIESKSLFSIGIVSMINNGISQMLYLIDIFVLGIVASDESILASYKVATIIPTALTFIPASFVTYIYPHFAEHRFDKKWCCNRYKQLLKYVGIFNAAISSFLYIFAPLILKILFGNVYIDNETILIFRILSLNYFISGTFRTIAGNLLVTQRKLKYNTLVAITSGVVNILGDYFFINIMGAKGAALATVMVVVVSSIMNVGYLLYTFKQD